MEVNFDLLPEEIDAAVARVNAAEEPSNPVPDNLQACQQELHETRRQLNDLSTDFSKAKEALRATHLELRNMATETADLVAENRELKKTPLGYAMVIGLNQDDGTVDVEKDDGNPLRVAVLPQVERADLISGATVLMSSGAIQKVVEARHVGRQATIASILDKGTALVSCEGDRKEVVRIAGNIEQSRLETGAPVMVRGGFITKLIIDMDRSNPLGSAARWALVEEPDVTFEDIGGLDDELKEIVDSLEDPSLVPEAYRIFAMEESNHTLLIGRPGNGKTMTAKAIARQSFEKYRDRLLAVGAKGNFAVTSGTELYARYLGDTEKAIRDIGYGLQRLHELTGAPTFWFLDDCEAFFLTRDREMTNTNINGSVVTQFSALVDGARKLKGVNIIAATNRPDLMDTAILRRFDNEIRIKPPTTSQRALRVLEKHLRGIPTQDAPGALMEEFIGSIFAKTAENNILRVHFNQDDETEIITLSQLLSGKILRDVVRRAKIVAKDRIKVLPEEQRIYELTRSDLDKALDRQLRHKESLPTTTPQVREWYRQGGDKRDVDEVINLREYRKAERKRDLRADRNVE